VSRKNKKKKKKKKQGVMDRAHMIAEVTVKFFHWALFRALVAFLRSRRAPSGLTRALSTPGWEGRTGLAERRGDGASVSEHSVIIIHSVTIIM